MIQIVFYKYGRQIAFWIKIWTYMEHSKIMRVKQTALIIEHSPMQALSLGAYVNELLFVYCSC